MSVHSDVRVEALKENEWLEGSVAMDEISEKGAGEYFNFENIKDFSRVFSREKRKDLVCCMDEGTAHINNHEMSILGMAGSGILYPDSSWDERLERVARLYKKMGIHEITSHEGCGAAKIAWINAGKENGTGFENPDDYGKKWAQELQAKMNEDAEEGNVGYRHITAGEMVRQPQYHNARVVWFDATGRFNPGKLEIGDQPVLPKGFLIDYSNETELAENDDERNYPSEELKVALAIAFGDHGFGDKFTANKPFIIIIPADSAVQLEEVKKQVERIVANSKFSDRVKIDGFVQE